MNRATEDYVKAIYQLKEHSGQESLVSNNLLSKTLKHTAQTVNEMIKKLSEKNLLIYKPYKGSKLTDEGNELAIKMLRKHRLWEVFLVKELGYTWSSIHDEADLLEHVTSDKLEEKLYLYLDKPKRCPHGNYIPNIHTENDDHNSVVYEKMLVGKVYKLLKVSDRKEVLDYLDKLEFHLGDSIKIIEVDNLNETIHMKLKDKIFIIGFKVAMHLFFEEI